MTIRMLSDETINKIAAGEVIEDPSSVIKELVDNAIDAHANFIEVTVSKGGFSEILVSDDGEGMTENEAKLCILRHATKKIRDAEDLLKIETMGFRGEALAAIASISKLQIYTSQSELGVQLQFFAAKLQSCIPKARKKGSSFRVQNLFYNTPARKKFQKSISSSTSSIVQLMSTMILSHPMIGFTLKVDDRLQFHHVPTQEFNGSLKAAIECVLKSDFYDEMKSICTGNKHFRLEGYIGSTQQAKHSRQGQYLFINQRPVKSNFIADTIASSYATRIASGSHIPFVLFLEMPSHWLDVNVHPKKIHVRFSDASLVQSFVSTAISQALEKKESFGSKLHFAPQDSFFSEDVTGQAQSFVFDDYIMPKKNIVEPDQARAFDEIEHNVVALTKNLFFLNDFINHTQEILIVDLRRAQKAIATRELNENLQNDTSSLNMQSLMNSPIIQLASAQFITIMNNLHHLERLGIKLKEFGPQTFAVEALYEGYCVESLQELVETIADAIKKDRGVRLEKYINISAAFSSGQSYTHSEAIEITKRILKEKDRAGSLLIFDQKMYDFCTRSATEVL
jgi:DNA mismatch repair protein MutL